MCLIGAIGWIRGSLIFITQIIGAIAASGIVSALFPNSMNVRTTLNDTSVVRGLFIEMFLTAMLVFTIFMLAAEKHKSTFLAPVGIGLALFIAEMSGQYNRMSTLTIQSRRLIISCRCLLYRRQPQSGSLLWPRRRSPYI